MEKNHKDKLLYCTQVIEFLGWCTAEERNSFAIAPNIEVQLRLAFIAREIGFGDLALSLMANISLKKLEEYIAHTPPLSLQESRAVQAEWMREFVNQQPEGKARRKLIRRLYKRGRYPIK